LPVVKEAPSDDERKNRWQSLTTLPPVRSPWSMWK
jgi:hypothetical protein